MTWLLALGLLAVFGSILLAGAAVVPGRGADAAVTRSLEAISALRAAPGDLRTAELAEPFTDRVLDPLVRRFTAIGRRLTPEEAIQRIRRRLDLAGNPPGWDTDRILGLKALCGLLGAALGSVLPPLLGVDLLPSFALTGLIIAAGWFGPSAFLYQWAYQRSERIRRELPDALDLLTISVEAGLGFDAALSQVARRTTGPLAREFFRVLQEMQLGTGRGEAMHALGERTDVAELRSFLGAMTQADEFGIPVSDVLRIQAKEMRVKRSQRAEEMAQKVPVKILFPLVFCIMPCLFIVVLGPAAIIMVQNFTAGGF